MYPGSRARRKTSAPLVSSAAMEAPPLRTPRALPGLAAAAALAPVAYQLARAFERTRGPEADPSVIVFTERSALLDRLGYTAYAGLALAVFVAPWLARRPALAAPVVRACVWAGAAAGLVGGAWR